MRVDSKSLTTFFRDQGIYLSIALVIDTTFWVLGLPARINQQLLAQVTEFCGAQFKDDATLLVLAVK